MLKRTFVGHMGGNEAVRYWSYQPVRPLPVRPYSYRILYYNWNWSSGTWAWKVYICTNVPTDTKSTIGGKWKAFMSTLIPENWKIVPGGDFECFPFFTNFKSVPPILIIFLTFFEVKIHPKNSKHHKYGSIFIFCILRLYFCEVYLLSFASFLLLELSKLKEKVDVIHSLGRGRGYARNQQLQPANKCIS